MWLLSIQYYSEWSRLVQILWNKKCGTWRRLWKSHQGGLLCFSSFLWKAFSMQSILLLQSLTSSSQSTTLGEYLEALWYSEEQIVFCSTRRVGTKEICSLTRQNSHKQLQICGENCALLACRVFCRGMLAWRLGRCTPGSGVRRRPPNWLPLLWLSKMHTWCWSGC